MCPPKRRSQIKTKKLFEPGRLSSEQFSLETLRTYESHECS